MKKNSHLHIHLETNLLEKIKRESLNKGITMSELCRQKLSMNLQLDKIENLIIQILNKMKN